MTQPARRYDACIIGSGAGGAVVATVLAEAGWDVLVVEQGDRVAPGTHLHELIPSFETARARTPDGRWSEAGYPWAACCVGGGTRFYAGVSLRLRLVDFDASAHVAGDALPPAWPFGYEDLRSHYEWVESRIGVTSDGGLDPTAPSPACGVLPPHAPSARGVALRDAGRLLGLSPFPVPLAVASRPFYGAPACTDLTACTDYACPSGAKGDVYLRLLAPLLSGRRLELWPRTKAVELLDGRAGATGTLRCLDLATGTARQVHARIFVVAANAIQTSALLLRSRSRRHPDGIGNDGDLVGRGLCMKVAQNIRGSLRQPFDAEPAANGGRFVTIGFSDYYLEAGHYLEAGSAKSLGGLIIETGPLEPDEFADRTLLRVECLLADQPTARNRVLLDDAELNADGLARIVIDYRPHPVDIERLGDLRQQATDLLRAAGAETVKGEPLDFTLGSAHLHGTCRMGTDRVSSVCDPDGRVHTSDNVYVADGALFPYPGSVNPALTIQAVAHRVATRLLERGR